MGKMMADQTSRANLQAVSTGLDASLMPVEKTDPPAASAYSELNTLDTPKPVNSGAPVLVLGAFGTPEHKPSYRVGNLSRGELMSRILEDGGLQVKRVQGTGSNWQGRVLEEIANQVESGKLELSAVTLTGDVSFPTFGVSRDNPELTPENFSKNRDAVEAVLPRSYEIRDRLNAAIDRIQTAGIPVYIGAGDNGRGEFNTIGLNAIQVGTLDQYGKVDPDSAKNSFVDRYEPGTHYIKAVPGGYDINNNGTADIKPGEIDPSNPKHEFRGYERISSSAFAAAAAIVKDLGAK